MLSLLGVVAHVCHPSTWRLEDWYSLRTAWPMWRITHQDYAVRLSESNWRTKPSPKLNKPKSYYSSQFSSTGFDTQKAGSSGSLATIISYNGRTFQEVGNWPDWGLFFIEDSSLAAWVWHSGAHGQVQWSYSVERLRWASWRLLTHGSVSCVLKCKQLTLGQHQK